MKKGMLIPALLGLVLIGLYSKRKLDGSTYQSASIEQEATQIASREAIKNGDIIFQTSLSGQSNAIQLATHSKYSHCGLIYKEGNNYMIFEAVQPVKNTPLDEWINRGKGGKYIIKRLENADQILTPAVLNKMKEVGNSFIGKDYDLTFEWSDDNIYCSELIWKNYQRATGIEIGRLQQLKDFDLNNEVVKEKMKERYGDKIPMNETVISPDAIFESKLLRTIKANY